MGGGHVLPDVLIEGVPIQVELDGQEEVFGVLFVEGLLHRPEDFPLPVGMDRDLRGDGIV